MTVASQFGAPQGAFLPNTPVTVYDTGTNTVASLYKDAGSASAAPNPFNADEFGNVNFYAASGTYDVKQAVVVTLGPAVYPVQAV
jgi:hypothetical protein